MHGSGIRAKVRELNDRVAALEESLMKATEDKNQAIAQAEKTAKKAGLADRLINGLSGENKRWNEEILKFEVKHHHFLSHPVVRSRFGRFKRANSWAMCSSHLHLSHMQGHSICISGDLGQSLCGRSFLPCRIRLVEEKWLPDLIGREIPISDNIKPLDMLANDRSKATWANEG